MGAEVTAQLRRPDFADMVRATGVSDVVISADGAALEDRGKFRSIIDGVGGHILSNCDNSLESICPPDDPCAGDR